jgi:hypothetical protein
VQSKSTSHPRFWQFCELPQNKTVRRWCLPLFEHHITHKMPLGRVRSGRPVSLAARSPQPPAAAQISPSSPELGQPSPELAPGRPRPSSHDAGARPALARARPRPPSELAPGRHPDLGHPSPEIGHPSPELGHPSPQAASSQPAGEVLFLVIRARPNRFRAEEGVQRPDCSAPNPLSSPRRAGKQSSSAHRKERAVLLAVAMVASPLCLSSLFCLPSSLSLLCNFVQCCD